MISAAIMTFGVYPHYFTPFPVIHTWQYKKIKKKIKKMGVRRDGGKERKNEGMVTF
jgi:hypothetical protein